MTRLFLFCSRVFVVLKRTVYKCVENEKHLFRTGVLGDGFGTFGDGVLGQLTGQQQTHGSLNFSASDRRTFVVVCQTGSFSGDTFEDVVHETVHYAHSLTRDTGVGMDLFQHLVDVDGIALLPPALLFFVALGNVLLSFPGLLGCLTTCLRRHFSTNSRTALTRVRACVNTYDGRKTDTTTFLIGTVFTRTPPENGLPPIVTSDSPITEAINSKHSSC
jgi:hypothetical protein